MAVLPGFLRDEALPPLARECDALAARGHFSEVRGTPYIDVPDLSLPEGHPRRTLGRTALSAVAYDRFPAASALRALYEWDPLLEFVRVLLGRERLFRYADPLGALNLAVMRDGDELAWHYDQTDFVVSIAIQSSEAGGEFECVPMIRSADDERYDDVRALLAGDPRVPRRGGSDDAGHADAVRRPPLDPPRLADPRRAAAPRGAARLRHEARHRQLRAAQARPLRPPCRRGVALRAHAVIQIGEAFVGEGAEAAHLNTVLGPRDGPVGAPGPPRWPRLRRVTRPSLPWCGRAFRRNPSPCS